MKNNLVFRILALTIFFGLITLEMFGQTGTGKIVGKVTDKKTGEALIGLNIKLAGTSRGAATDVEGRYVLTGLAAGKYTLQFSYVGYATKSVSDVIVKAGGVTTLDATMEEGGANTLQAVVINVSAKQESVAGLYAQQKNAVSVSSGVSSEQISKSPDRNTSEVLKRVSGASIQDNKFVVVRGLSDRYNTSALNNTVLPSTEPDRKAFSFDIIPSNLVDRIVVNKTAAANLPGDFAGGMIQVVTKDVPDQSFFSFGTSWGYNSQSTTKPFISNRRNSYDWIGFDDGTRSLPSSFPKSFQEYNPLPVSEKVQYSKQLSNLYPERTSTALPVKSFQVTWGDRTTLKNGGSLGSIASLSYRNAQTINFVTRRDYENEFRNVYYQYSDDEYKYSTSLGALANITYKKDNLKLSFKNLYNRVFDDAYTDRNGFNTNIDGRLKFNNSDLTQKTVLNSQIEGDHQLGKSNKLNWNFTYALIARSQPDLRSIYYRQAMDAPAEPYHLVDRNSRRFFSDLNENNYSAQVNYTVSLDMFKEKAILKTGLMKAYKSRDFNARIFNYLFNSSGSASYDDYLLSQPKDVIFAKENIGSEGGFYLQDFTQNTDTYQAQTDLNSGYAMLENNLGKKFRLNWGVRIENYYQNIDTRDLSGSDKSFGQTFLDILPSANLIYSLTEKANLRVSASRTVSRPELRELAPFAFYDFVSQTSTLGNPDLKRGQITNLDFRYEIYPSASQSITASLFFKDFTNPIEQVLDEGGTPERRQVTFQNALNAQTYGAELEIRRNLDFLGSEFLNNVTMFTNLSYIRSEVKLGTLNAQSRPLQGQSPYLINGGLQYSSKSGWSAVALYNRVGQRIAFVGNVNYPNIYENARDVVDLQIGKRLIKNNLDLKLNLSDLLNQNSIFYLNMDNKKAYNADVDKVYSTRKLGTNISLSLTYNIKLAK